MAYEQPPLSRGSKNASVATVRIPMIGDPSLDAANVTRYENLGYTVKSEEKGHVTLTAPKEVAERLQKQQIDEHNRRANARPLDAHEVTNEIVSKADVSDLLGD